LPSDGKQEQACAGVADSVPTQMQPLIQKMYKCKPAGITQPKGPFEFAWDALDMDNQQTERADDIQLVAMGNEENCANMNVADRVDAPRRLQMFQEDFRGRGPVPEDVMSNGSPHRSAEPFTTHDAGILFLCKNQQVQPAVTQEWEETGAAGYFPEAIYKKGGAEVFRETRPTIQGLHHEFEAIGAPFIAGTSGHVQKAILLAERKAFRDWCNTDSEQHRNGRIDCSRDRREKFIAIFAAAQIAAGMHSLLESFMVAHEMGYFVGVPALCPEGAEVPPKGISAALAAFRSLMGCCRCGQTEIPDYAEWFTDSFEPYVRGIMA